QTSLLHLQTHEVIAGHGILHQLQPLSCSYSQPFIYPLDQLAILRAITIILSTCLIIPGYDKLQIHDDRRNAYDRTYSSSTYGERFRDPQRAPKGICPRNGHERRNIPL
ncbi:hypothetical protein CNYM01_00605, partial [Colletotrichum nymphaeae SA-01]